jgi:hypothetical protein
MIQDEIIEMAKQASGGARVPDILIPVFERFAKLVAQHEREACAKVVEAWSDWHGGTETLAKAIRAREQA